MSKPHVSLSTFMRDSKLSDSLCARSENESGSLLLGRMEPQMGFTFIHGNNLLMACMKSFWPTLPAPRMSRSMRHAFNKFPRSCKSFAIRQDNGEPPPSPSVWSLASRALRSKSLNCFRKMKSPVPYFNLFSSSLRVKQSCWISLKTDVASPSNLKILQTFTKSSHLAAHRWWKPKTYSGRLVSLNNFSKCPHVLPKAAHFLNFTTSGL
mmetsp:Transcript_73609/g.204592  ORF Transcript_73609/g.204592 Transcript_73609/m.204592 type:complete len:209 (-) Transcript_73609:1255-1881(-)